MATAQESDFDFSVLSQIRLVRLQWQSPASSKEMFSDS